MAPGFRDGTVAWSVNSDVEPGDPREWVCPRPRTAPRSLAHSAQVIAENDMVEDGDVEKILQLFARSNTPEQWCQRARDLMERMGKHGGADVWRQIAAFFEFGRDLKMVQYASGKKHVAMTHGQKGDGNPEWQGLIRQVCACPHTPAIAK